MGRRCLHSDRKNVSIYRKVVSVLLSPLAQNIKQYFTEMKNSSGAPRTLLLRSEGNIAIVKKYDFGFYKFRFYIPPTLKEKCFRKMYLWLSLCVCLYVCVCVCVYVCR